MSESSSSPSPPAPSSSSSPPPSPPAPSSSSSSSPPPSPPAPSASPPPSASSASSPPPPPSPPPSSPPPSSPPPSASPPPSPSDKKSPPSFALSPLAALAVESHPPPPQSSPNVGSGSPETDNASPPPPSSNSKPSSPPPPPPTNSGQPPPPSSTSNSWAPPPPVHQPPPPSTSPPPPSSSSSPPSPPASSSSSSSPPPTPPSAVSEKLPPPPSSGPTSTTFTTFSPPPPNSSPAQPLPAPDISSGTTPPAPPNAIPSPQNPGSTNGDTPPSPGITPSASLTKAPPNSPTEKLIPPSTHSGPSANPVHSNPSSKSNSSSTTGTIIGSTLAGVVVITMIVFVFYITRKKKKRGAPAYNGQYGPTPTNFIVGPDGYQYKQQRIPQHILVGSAQTDGLYNGRHPLSPSVVENSAGNAGTDPGGIGGSKSCFSYEKMMEVTNGFSQQNILGEGGFGCVYKGWLPDGRVVAVKQLKAGSGQGEREFRAEVEIISRVHHRHLVSLVGYCIDNHHRLLVYEFLPNNNLEHHLHGKGMPVLEWSKRIKIAIGSARGLAYLHEDCHPKIIHRDIKSANILLDNAFEAQVADFGLAKLTNDTNTHVSTRVMGTFGYLAPEYASSGKLTDRSDVYSFGVVLLELVTGRKPVDPTQPLGDESLVEWARPLLINALDTGDFTTLIDPRLERRYVESEMIRMIEAAAACVRHSAPKRPRMAQVVRALDTEGDLTDLTNGVKLGQSTAYDSGQYSAEVKDFRRMAFGYLDSSDYGMSSGEATSVTVPHSSIELLSSDSESHAKNPIGNATAQSRHDGGKQV